MFAAIYESPTHLACRVTSFFIFATAANTFFCAFSEISCFCDVKTLAIIITSGNETLKVLGFKGTRKIDIVKALAIIITFGSDILKVLGFKGIQKTGYRDPYMIWVFQILTIFVKIFVKILTFTGTSIIKKKRY